jgi:hypothetical protein
LPLPLPCFFFDVPLKPLISSSRIIDGGLTFLPQPCVALWVSDAGAGAELMVSFSTGGAKTTAVEERPVPTTGTDERTAAPAGSRGADAFDFWAWFRRTGAKARAADHASEVILVFQ